jgi:diguanylate cyclase (GGDEF)-like protein
MTATYDLGLVALSLFVAILASYTALDLAARITASAGIAARLWLLGGAFSMGIGIWSMHFVGMLAFNLPIPMGYDVPVTLLSLVIAVVVSGFALFTVTRSTMSRRHLLVGGVLMGVGISTMHYTGMAAMDMFPPIRYDQALFTASVVIAIAASHAALWIAFHLRSNERWMVYAKGGSAVVMGLAITGMHYTGMAAAQFAPDTICLSGAFVDNSWMAFTIVAFTISILTATLLLSLYDSRMASASMRLAESLQKANAELQHMALHDGLTSLPNRLLLEDRIDQAIAQAQRSRSLCAVLFVDLDQFKGVNDSLGHFVGDELLKTMSARLIGAVRSEDTVSRLGGDEFVILLRNVHAADDAGRIAAKIVDALSKPARILTHDVEITASVGISVFPFNGRDARELIVNADAAMYQAKTLGRNNFQFFTEETSSAYRERLKLHAGLRHAIERGEFELHYHPKVNVKTNEIVGMEALVRWRHPEMGLIPPADFIPAAEETGLILPIGNWVLHEACRQNKEWQDRGLARVRVAVNLSALQFQRNVLDAVSKALQATGLEARYLELEITESVVMQNAAEAVLTLEQLSRMGVHISIDDFGTGYSSLSYLKRFPLQTLKIDRSFIREVNQDPDDAAIVSAIIALAHNLRLKVVAEGVETEQQLNTLRLLGGAASRCPRENSSTCSPSIIAVAQSWRHSRRPRYCPRLIWDASSGTPLIKVNKIKYLYQFPLGNHLPPLESLSTRGDTRE